MLLDLEKNKCMPKVRNGYNYFPVGSLKPDMFKSFFQLVRVTFSQRLILLLNYCTWVQYQEQQATGWKATVTNRIDGWMDAMEDWICRSFVFLPLPPDEPRRRLPFCRILHLCDAFDVTNQTHPSMGKASGGGRRSTRVQ